MVSIKVKVFFVRILLSIILLFLVVGHLGLALFSAHWFSLLRNEFWPLFEKPEFKGMALSITIITAIVLALTVVDLTLEFHKIYAIIASILMIAVFAIVIYLLTQLTTNKANELRALAPKVLSSDPKFATSNSCTWNMSSVTTTLKNCTEEAESYIEMRLHWTFNWYLFYLLSWIISFCVAIPFVCFTSKSHLD